MRRVLSTGLLLAMGTAGINPTSAVLPPPPPPGYRASWAAIDRLNVLVGRWNGDEVQHVMAANGEIADFPRRRYLDIERPEGRDLLLVEGGSNDSPSHAEFTDVITFDPRASSYELFMPGYRAFSGSSKTSALVPISQGRDGRLSWSIARDDGATLRVSAWLDAGALHERQELITPSGTVRDEADAVLTKAAR